MPKATDSIPAPDLYDQLVALHARLDTTQLSTPEDICELGIRLRLRKAGLRLERLGFGYRIVYRLQVVVGGEFEMSLADIAAFTDGAFGRGTQ